MSALSALHGVPPPSYISSFEASLNDLDSVTLQFAVMEHGVICQAHLVQEKLQKVPAGGPFQNLVKIAREKNLLVFF